MRHIVTITDISRDVKTLIEYEKYEEALEEIFIDKTDDEKKIEEKKKFLKEILEKKPDLEKKAKELNVQYKTNLFWI